MALGVLFQKELCSLRVQTDRAEQLSSTSARPRTSDKGARGQGGLGSSEPNGSKPQLRIVGTPTKPRRCHFPLTWAFWIPVPRLGSGDSLSFRELLLPLKEIAPEQGRNCVSLQSFTSCGGGGPIRPMPWSLPRSQLPEREVIPLRPLLPPLGGSDTRPCFTSWRHDFYEQPRCQ